MSADSDPDVGDAAHTSTDGGNAVESGGHSVDADSSRDLRTYVNYAVLAGLGLLALVATLQFYLSASQAINIWVTPEYRSLFQAVFNLVVLLVVGAGITLQLRRLSGS